MEQRSLVLSTKNSKTVTDEEILRRCLHFKDALRLCKELSPLNDQQLADNLDLDPAQWSRIWSDRGHFPDEKIERFMALCENIVPARYLALKQGFELKPLKSTLEMENESLRKALEEKEKELDVITKWQQRVAR